MACGRPEIKFEEHKINEVKIKREKDDYRIQVTITGISFSCLIPMNDCEDDFQEKAKFWKRIFILSYGLSSRLIIVDNGHTNEAVIILDRLGGIGKKFRHHYCNGKIVKEI